MSAAGPGTKDAASLARMFRPGAFPRRFTARMLANPYLLIVTAVAVLNTWSFRAEALPVAYLYDGSVHQDMVQAATSLIERGQLPLTAWFPYVGLGSAQFMHYQSLASVITGIAGTVVGATTAYRWAIVVLVGFWPVAIYSSARVFKQPRTTSMLAAVISPLVVSYTGIAFERGAYSWVGGAEVWTQLFGMWLLPFAWALTWRALGNPRFIWAAAAAVSFTFAFHFICGYLAFFGTMIFPFVSEGYWRQRFTRAAAVLAGSLAASAWLVVPLVLFSKWSAINELLAETPYVRGYGAGREIAWLFKGEIFDARRAVPVVSGLVLIGIVATLFRWRTKTVERGLLALFVGCLLLSFGGTTWGPFVDLVPAHADLYFRRFNMGTQLAGIYLASAGVMAAWRIWWRLADSFVGGRSTASPVGAGRPTNETAPARATPAQVGRGPFGRLALGKTAFRATAISFVLIACAWAWPAVHQIYRYDRGDASTIKAQRSADAVEGAQLAPIIRYLRSHGGGRVYAGQSGNWGSKFLVGYVPVYKYLLAQGVEESTYVVPTTSLMLGPEAEFDVYNPADYALFGIRYLLLPSDLSPPVPARQIMASGDYSLWQLTGYDYGYAELVSVTARFAANRADIGPSSALLLETIGEGEDWQVEWPGLAQPSPSSVRGGTGVAGAPEASRSRGASVAEAVSGPMAPGEADGAKGANGAKGGEGITRAGKSYESKGVKEIKEIRGVKGVTGAKRPADVKDVNGDEPSKGASTSRTAPVASVALPGEGLGDVQVVSPDLVRGEISADVDVARRSSLLFSVAFDPGWHAWVDGRSAPTEMLAPALVGVALSPGEHHVVLRYIGFGWYPELWAFSLLSLLILAFAGWSWRQPDAGKSTSSGQQSGS